MSNLRKYFKIIRYFIMIALLLNVIGAYVDLNIPVGIQIIFPILIVNDIIRTSVNRYSKLWYCISIVISIIGAAILRYYINRYITSIYMFYYVIEIFYLQSKCKQYLLAFHCILYLITVVLTKGVLNISQMVTTIGTSLLTYLSIICILYLSYRVRTEREETKKLNEELKISNIKLREYSLEVEELSTARERERVAQELHDSLGHSLMALTMHLEYAEKIFDTNPEKAKEVILKARSISKNSTASLRMAVDTLKKERNIEDLRNAINELINNFGILGNIKIDFSMDEQMEVLNPEIKLCVYRTIRESLTNGIKHGKASAFNITAGVKENQIKLIIQDNGAGCDTIIKSNGLRGIENRILALGGRVDFKSQCSRGFLIEAEVPLYEEMK